ncbi:MAG: hypothetical protein VCF08_22250 [Alphaproteobacteria bacterium]
MPDNSGQKRSYLVEFQAIGNAVKVSALDPATLLEFSILGPTTATETEFSRLAVQKLEYMLQKREAQPDGRGGIKA